MPAAESHTEQQLLDQLLGPMLGDAEEMVRSGVAEAADVDLAMRLGARHAEGPFEFLAGRGSAEAERLLARSPRTPGAGQSADPVGAAGRLPDGTVGVLGTGFMASGIAYAFAVAGAPVLIVGRSQTSVQGSRDRIERDFGGAVRRGRMREDAAEAAAGRIGWTTEIDRISVCTLVIEAVAENLEVKREVFAAADRALPGEVSLATNTSSLTVASIGTATEHPERVIGMHFFSPVPAMKLVEVIGPRAVEEERLIAATDWAEAIGKVPVRCADSTGFIVNRLLIPMLNDAVRANDEGLVSIDEIDEVLCRPAGHPMGPFALLDLIGLDVALAAQRSIHEAFGTARLAPAKGLSERVEAGRLGRKSGAGFHRYHETPARS